jgi:hypothetical protein
MSGQRKSILVSLPWIDEREAEAARRPILSGWVTMGPEVERFEQEFAGLVGARHACAVPLYHQMTGGNQDYVVEQLATMVAGAPAL